MKKFVIENDFWDVFPNAKVGIVTCKGIDNSLKETEKYEKMLREAEKEAEKHFPKGDFITNPVISAWREAFRKFKTKKGARASIEALLKRVKKGNHIGTINPLVDIYNSISLKYGLPCGGEDIDTFAGDIRLTKAKGNEEFVPLGDKGNDPPYEGEIIYKDDAGAICRCWNWRESMRTILTENTKHAFLCIELVEESKVDDLQMALKDLAKLVEENLGGEAEIQMLDINNKEISF